MGKKTADLQKGIICNRADNHFFRFFSSLSENDGFIKLSANAQLLYLRMGIASKGRLEYEFPFSVYGKYMSKATFQTAKQQLIDGGFITEKKFRCSKNLYRFSNQWQNKSPQNYGKA